MKKVTTERLIIRRFKQEDAKSLLAYLEHPRVNCFLDEKLSNLEEAQKEAAERSKGDDFLAICLKETDELIGELMCIKEEPDTYCIGWHLNSDYEGKGYAMEAVTALLEWLFNEQDARRVYAYAEEDNIRSRSLCERLGMRLEGCFMEFISFTTYEDGTPKYENTCQYALLKKEWIQK